MTLPPLTLARRLMLIVAPLKGSVLVELMRDARQLARFRELFHQYLPDLEAQAFGPGMEAMERLNLFGQAFSERYFPIVWSIWGVDYDEILEYIPIEPMGISCEQYYNGAYDCPSAYMVLICLLESPYTDLEMIDDGEDEEGQPLDPERVTYLASRAEIVGRDMAQRVPVDGIPHDLLTERLSGTRYEAALVMYDILHETSPYIWLCLDQEDYEEGDMDIWAEDFAWNPERVTVLAKEWPQAKAQLDSLGTLVDWLEQDMPRHSAELLDAALGQAQTTPRTQRKRKGANHA